MLPLDVRALDPHTLLFSLGVLGFVMCAVFLGLARAMPAYRAAFVAWSQATVAAGSAFVLYFLRGQAPPLLTFVGANVVMVGLGHWGHVAHARLLDMPVQRRWTLGAAALGLGGVLGCQWLALPQRVAFISMSAAFAVMLGATALLVLRGTRQRRSPSALATLVCHALLAVAFALRALLGLVFDEGQLMPGSTSVAQLFTLVPGLVLLVVCPICFLYMVHEHDVSLARARQQELERLTRQEQQASAMKTQFLSSMSHEIRTPLNAILGTAQVLALQARDAEQQRLVGAIRTAGRTLLALVNDALDLSRIEAGRMRLERRPFQLHEVLARAVEVLAPTAQAKGLRLELGPLPESLPVLAGDALRLEQLVYNLVGNAIKFTDTGAVSIEVVTLLQDARRVTLQLTVRDSGIGIKADRIEHIFDPFTQDDAASGGRYGGTGLGLAICRQLVALMGGRIGARSQPGAGSEFWLVLPFDVADAPAAAPPSAPETATAAGGQRLEGLRVLVVDDVPANLDVALSLLASEGAQATGATSGEQALAQLRQAGPGGIDAVLLDVQMPGLDGIEVTRRLRADAALAGLPVIALTAGALPEQRERALAAGMDDFLAKPVELEALVDTLLRWAQPRGPRPAHAPSRARAAHMDGAVFPALAGIDLRRAQQRFSGDRALFLRLLQGLRDDHAGVVEAVRAEVGQGQWAQAAMRVHKLCGLAGTVSAEALAAAAAALEAALRAQRQDTLGPLLDAVDRALRTVLATLPRAVDAAPEVPVGVAGSASAAQADLPRHVAALLAALQAYDTAALDQFEALRAALAERHGAQALGRLEPLLYGLRFKQACAVLRSWGYQE